MCYSSALRDMLSVIASLTALKATSSCDRSILPLTALGCVSRACLLDGLTVPEFTGCDKDAKF